jgi:threonine aldolase
VAGLRDALAREGIRASIGAHTRLVTHLDVSRADVDKVVAVFKAYFKDWRA